MPRIPFIKPALNITQQLQTLKSRGLQINNEVKVLHLLENISYFRLSSYWYPLIAKPKSAKIFKPNANFDKAFKLYCFDKELRRFILSELDKIEISFRAKMNNVLSIAYSPFWIEDVSLFQDAGAHSTSMIKLRKEINRSDEVFIKDFRSTYNNPLPPSWMLLEVVSFGTISTFYKNLNSSPAKREIAKYFGLDESTFESWFHTMSYIRNTCAHDARMWNRLIPIRPQIPRKPIKTWLKSGTISNQKVYFILSAILYLLQTVNPKSVFKKRLFRLLKKYPNTDIFAMGFPPDWKEEPLWKSPKKKYKLLFFIKKVFT